MGPSEETLDKVAYYLQLGLPKTTIGKKLGVSVATISNWSKKFGLMCRDVEAEKQKRDYPWQIIFHCRDLALHKENMSIDDISEKYGVPTSIIQKWVEGYINGNDYGTTQQIIALADEMADLREPMENVQREVKMRDLEVRVAIYEAAEDYLKGVGISKATAMQKTSLVDALFPQFPKTLLFKWVGILSSTYYACKKRTQQDKYAEIRPLIRKIYDGANGARGYRYVHNELRKLKNPIKLSHNTVRKIMKQEGLRAIYYKKSKHYNSFAGDGIETPKNLIERDFHAEKPNELWLTDITQMTLPAGKVFLSPLLDCFDGALVSWRIERRPTGNLVNEMLREGISKLKRGERPILHTDHGVHYQWPGWIKICDQNEIIRSMSRKGCSPDNAAMEGFFGRMKNEFFYHRNWKGVSVDEFIEKLNDYLIFYNERRPKEKLAWMSPIEYRKSIGYLK